MDGHSQLRFYLDDGTQLVTAAMGHASALELVQNWHQQEVVHVQRYWSGLMTVRTSVIRNVALESVGYGQLPSPGEGFLCPPC